LPTAIHAAPAASAAPIIMIMSPGGPLRIVIDASKLPAGMDSGPAGGCRSADVPLASLPPINSLIDLILVDGELFASRVEGADGNRLVVGAPIGIHAADVPKLGSALEIAWVTEEARQAVDVRLKSIRNQPQLQWELDVIGSVRLQTRRTYVRGGGGERIEVVKDGTSVDAKVVDLSEGGVRLRTVEDRFDRDDRVGLNLVIEDTRVPLQGTVLFVRRNPETESFDVIITYDTGESIGRLIRSYVMRREMEARRRLRESVANA